MYQAQEGGKLRLRQLRNSAVTIKNAIKVIPAAAAVRVSKRFPIARRRGASSSPISEDSLLTRRDIQ